MKRTYLLTLLAALTLVGCSKHKPETVTGPDAWKYDESLPVPIMFGGMDAGMMTKTIVNTTSDLEADKVGVLGLDLSEEQAGWRTTGEYPALKSVLLNNEAASVSGTDGLVEFKEGKKYYPLSGTQTFDFYAYYPRLEAGSGLSCIESNTATSYYQATYTIGDTDILWAKAPKHQFTLSNGNTYHSYNAAYVRKLNEFEPDEQKRKTDWLPRFKFEHKLTALEFILQATPEVAVNLSNANAVISGLTINNTYTQARLVIADKDPTEDNSGKLFTEDRYIGNIKMKDANGSTTFAINMRSGTQNNGNHEIKFGNGLLLVPNPAEKCFKGKLHITLGGVVQDIEFTLTDPNASTGKNFEAGAKYTYTIVVKDPQEIVAYAEMTAWDEYDGGIIDEMN